jgi:hypothetical protein
LGRMEIRTRRLVDEGDALAVVTVVVVAVVA